MISRGRVMVTIKALNSAIKKTDSLSRLLLPRYATNLFAGLVLIFAVIQYSQAEDGLGYQGKDSEGLSPEALLLKLKSDGEIQIREERGWIVAASDKLRSIWSFPPTGHPAYPAYVKREVVEKDGSIYIETSVRCGAEKSECDKLVKDFIELNGRAQREINAR
jgi:hypothetical protein